MKKFKFIALVIAIVLSFNVTQSVSQSNGSRNSEPASSGIQWYSTLETGLAEAKRTGRPILFLTALPSCGGVPGIW